MSKRKASRRYGTIPRFCCGSEIGTYWKENVADVSTGTNVPGAVEEPMKRQAMRWQPIPAVGLTSKENYYERFAFDRFGPGFLYGIAHRIGACHYYKRAVSFRR